MNKEETLKEMDRMQDKLESLMNALERETDKGKMMSIYCQLDSINAEINACALRI